MTSLGVGRRTVLNHIRVLVADDHRAARRAASLALAGHCEIVAETSRGDTVLALVQQVKPDVVLLDVSMPGLDGIEVARQLNRAGCDARVVMLSGHDDPEFVRASLEAGALAYVVKPSLASDLALAVEEVVKGNSFVSPAISLGDAAM